MRAEKGTKESTRRREQFILAYAATGNATAAAAAAGYSHRSARQQATVLMADPSIAARARDARELFLADRAAALERAMAALIEGAPEAIKSLQDLSSNAKSEMARVNAATAMLLYAGLKPPERVESKNEHSFPDQIADEVDSRIDRALGLNPTSRGTSGDRTPTH